MNMSFSNQDIVVDHLWSVTFCYNTEMSMWD